MTTSATEADTLEGYPLAPAQLAAWQARSGDRTRNTALCVSWPEPVSKRAVRQHLQAAAGAQPIFATRFVQAAGLDVPMQVIGASAPRLVEETFGDRTLAAGLATRLLGRGDLASLAIGYVAEGDALSELVLAAPAHIADADTLLMLLSATLEPSRTDDEEPLLYQHFSEWANEQKDGETGQAAAAAWRELAAARTGQSLALRSRPGGGMLSCRARRRLPAATTPDPAHREAALLTAWAVTAGQFLDTDEPDCIVGRYATGRLFDEFDGIAGPFRATAPLAVARSGSSGAAGLLPDLTAELERHDERSCFPGAQPLPAHDIGFACIRLPRRAEIFAAAELSLDLPEDHALSLVVLDAGDQVVLDVGCRAAEIDAAFAERLASALAECIAALIRDPGIAFDGLPRRATAPSEHPRHSQHGLVADRSLADAFRTAAERYADRIAVAAGEERIRFDALDRESEALGAALVSAGLAAGETVAIFADRSIDAVVAVLGASKAAAAFVPIHPDYPDERVRRMLSLARTRLAIYEPAEAERARRLAPGPVLPARGHQDVAAPRRPVTPETAAYVIFTSGSTGMPKGVQVPHGALMNLAAALDQRIYAGSREPLRVSVNAPLAFDASIKQLVQVLYGRTLCPVPAETRRDPGALVQFAVDGGLDVLDVTPTLLGAMIAQGYGTPPLPAPRFLLIGGEAIDPTLWQTLRTWTGSRAFNVYGPTETTVNALVAEIGQAGETPTIGTPLAGVTAEIADSHGQPVLPGAAGELLIGGAGVADGYVSAPRETEEAFLGRASGERVYRSGDRARLWADGQFEFLGRRDDQVKIAGYRIETGEVTAALRACPGIAGAYTFRHGGSEADASLVAVVAREPAPAGDALLVEIPTGHRIASVNVNETRYLYQEIFVDKAYACDGLVYPRDAVVLDVGANIGMFSLFATLHVPAARIIAFEPLAPIRQRLESNLRRYAPRVMVMPYGLSDRERDEVFTYYPGYSMMSSQAAYADAAAEVEVIKTYLGNAANAGQEEAGVLAGALDSVLDGRFDAERHEARLRRLSEVIDELGLQRIDLLKIDVQRAELDVLRGIEDRHWPLVRQIALEVHDAPGSFTAGRTGELRAFLESRGFEAVVRQDDLLKGTDRYTCVARRRDWIADAECADLSAAPAPIAGREHGTIDEDALKEALRAVLPGYMVPHRIVVADALPMNAQGKVDRGRVADLLAAPAAKEPQGAAAAPGSETERKLLEIWRTVLKQPAIGITDNFFQMGGDSIRSILMQSRARAAGLSFSLRDLLANQTVSDLAALIDRGGGRPAAPSLAAGAADDGFGLISSRDRDRLGPEIEAALPLTAMQTIMALASATARDARVFRNVTATHVMAALDADRLSQAITAAAKAHPVLRASIDLESAEEPMLLIHREYRPPLTVHDLGGRGAETLEDALRGIALAEHGRRIALDQPELVRFAAVTDPAQGFHLILAEHHAVLDGFSLDLVIDEIIARYGGEVTEPPADLPVLSRVVESERQAVADPASALFWLRHFSAAGAAQSGRLTGPRQPGAATSMLQVDVVGDADTARRLRAAAAAHRLPVKAVLFSVHAAALRSLCGPAVATTGLVANLRPEADGAEAAVGMFLNVQPVALAAFGSTAAETARSFFAFEQQAFPFRYVPGHDIRHWVGPAADFETLFNYVSFDDAGRQEAGLRGEERRFVAVDVMVPLAIDYDLSGGRLRIGFQVDQARVGPATVERLRAALVDALAQVLAELACEFPQRQPASDRESAVLQACEAVLGQPVDLDTDLRQQHLPSLHAVRLATNLQKLLGLRPSITDLLSATTPRAIAASLGVAGTRDAGLTGSRNREIRGRWLVGPSHTIEAPLFRVFAFPPAGSSARIFDPWRMRMPHGWDLHAIQYPGRQERADEPPVTRFAEMLDGICSEIEPLAERPYILVGASLGALLAFEAARRMRRTIGREPALLAVICARAPQLRLPYPAFHAMSDRILIKELQAFGGLSGEVLASEELLATVLDTVRADSRVSADYVYGTEPPLASTIVSLAARQDAGVSLAAAEAWQAQTTGRFKFVAMDGGHSALAADPERVLHSLGLQALMDSNQTRSAPELA